MPLLLPSSGAEKQKLTDISPESKLRTLEEAEAAGAHPALTQVVIMQGLVVGRSGTKKARIHVSALLPECQGNWKCEGSCHLLLLCKDMSAAAEYSASRQGRQSQDMLQSCSEG